MQQLFTNLVARILILSLLLLAPAAANDLNQIDVKITTHLGDQQSFVEGDKISFFLSLNQDAYIYLYYLDANGNLLQLMPNQRMPDNFYSSGLFMPVPPAKQQFQFIIRAPFGEEHIFVLATDNGEFKFQGETLDNGLILVNAAIEQLIAEIRQASSAFGSSELLLKTLSGAGAD